MFLAWSPLCIHLSIPGRQSNCSYDMPPYVTCNHITVCMWKIMGPTRSWCFAAITAMHNVKNNRSMWKYLPPSYLAAVAAGALPEYYPMWTLGFSKHLLFYCWVKIPLCSQTPTPRSSGPAYWILSGGWVLKGSETSLPVIYCYALLCLTGCETFLSPIWLLSFTTSFMLSRMFIILATPI